MWIAMITSKVHPITLPITSAVLRSTSFLRLSRTGRRLIVIISVSSLSEGQAHPDTHGGADFAEVLGVKDLGIAFNAAERIHDFHRDPSLVLDDPGQSRHARASPAQVDLRDAVLRGGRAEELE